MSKPNEKIKHLSLKAILGDRKLRKRLRPEYLEACRFFSCPLIDRTKTLDCGIDFEILDGLEGFRKSEASFESVCAARAEFIGQKAIEENRKIQLLWSGGIDSTLALIALYKDLKEKDELKRLEVLLSKESVAEYASFYAEIIEPALNYTIFQPPIYSYLDARKIVVTGEHGDQLFGSDKAKYYVIAKEAFRPYEDVLPYMIARKNGSEKTVDALIAYLEPQIKKSPVEILTLYDYLWWMNFSLKWQHVALRLINSAAEKKLSLNDNLIHFFSSADFQNWSLSNHHRKIKTSWKSYKYLAKEYIFDFHRDMNYLLNKEKEQSLKDAIVTSPAPLSFITRPFKRLIYR